jgi:hypothetical protein
VTGEGGTLLDYIFYIGTTLQPSGPVYYAPGGSQNEGDPNPVRHASC